MAVTAHNWAAAFTAFVGGSTLEEVSAVFGIPESTLKARSVSEKWTVMREKILDQSKALVVSERGPVSALQAQNDFLPAEVRARLALIKHNRDVQYSRAVKMGEELDRILQGVRDGSYKVGKWMAIPKMGPTWVESAVGPADLVNIATFARTLADLAYRALGDAAADGQERRTEVSATNSPQQAITIILPTAIGAPRGERVLPGQGPVIDLRPASTEPEREQPSPADAFEGPETPNGNKDAAPGDQEPPTGLPGQ
jgi:hypothetical protein